ncbi:hypothetical protein ACIPPS_14480 [Streptomyces sp. NPDC090127]
MSRLRKALRGAATLESVAFRRGAPTPRPKAPALLAGEPARLGARA